MRDIYHLPSLSLSAITNIESSALPAKSLNRIHYEFPLNSRSKQMPLVCHDTLLEMRNVV